MRKSNFHIHRFSWFSIPPENNKVISRQTDNMR